MASANRNAIKPVQTIAKLIGNLIFIFLLVLLCALVFLLFHSRISVGPPTVSWAQALRCPQRQHEPGV